MTVRYRYKDTTMLRASRAGTLYRPPTDDEGEVPLPAGQRSFTTPLEYDEGEEFEIKAKCPLDFPVLHQEGDAGEDDESPQAAGRRASKLERLLAEHNRDLELVEEDDED